MKSIYKIRLHVIRTTNHVVSQPAIAHILGQNHSKYTATPIAPFGELDSITFSKIAQASD